jgi:putative membrane protein
MKHLSFLICALLFSYLPVIAQNEPTDDVFIKKAASRNLMQIDLGIIAQQKAVNPQLRDFGRMVEKDYQNSNLSLMGVSVKLGMSPPSRMLDDDRITLAGFQDKATADFDSEYIEYMLKLHNEDITLMQNVRNEVNSNDLKKWIDGTLSILKEHVVFAENLKNRERK